MAKDGAAKAAPEEGNGFDPRVLVFACNWCSYAGADTAGVSRLAQTPHFRLLRVMCSGRVHPSFVLRAFARGADAVMVSGCHFGDCHYIFGNYRAVEQFEKTKALMDMLGLEPERLRLEWISAAEGIRFAEVMNEFVAAARAAGRSRLAPTAADLELLEPVMPEEAELISARTFSCFECGRCTGVCPVALYQPFSPRRLVSRTIASGLSNLSGDSSLWSCLTCHRCSLVCPTGVDYDQFVLTARAAAVARGSDASPPARGDARANQEGAKTAAAKAEVARTDTATTEAARTDTATTEAARTDAATTEAARTDAATTDAATTDAATTDAATTDADTTDANAVPDGVHDASAGPDPHDEARHDELGVIPCSHGGVFEQVSVMHTREPLRQRRLGWLTDDLEAVVLEEGRTGKTDDLLYVGCTPYFAAYFGGETGEGLTATAQAAVRLLNRVGVRPALLANERCCGYHMRLSGRTREADRLGELVAAQIRTSGAKRVITFCPECLMSLKETLGEHARGVEVIHLSEVMLNHREKLRALAEGLEQGASHTSGALAPSAGTSPSSRVVEPARSNHVTYQDPCRLGRHAGLYDPPRELLGLLGHAVEEMAHSRERAICCGNTAWLNCNAATKQFQAARLAEAAGTGAGRLVTACPGCFIHLRCAQEGELAAGAGTAGTQAGAGAAVETGAETGAEAEAEAEAGAGAAVETGAEAEAGAGAEADAGAGAGAGVAAAAATEAAEPPAAGAATTQSIRITDIWTLLDRTLHGLPAESAGRDAGWHPGGNAGQDADVNAGGSADGHPGVNAGGNADGHPGVNAGGSADGHPGVNAGGTKPDGDNAAATESASARTRKDQSAAATTAAAQDGEAR